MDKLYMKMVPFRSYGAVERDIEESSTRSNHSRWWWGVDLILIAIVIIPVFLFETGYIPVNKNGFYCNDPALMFPLKVETVTTNILFSGLFILPLLTFHITEYAVADDPRKHFQVLRNVLWLYRSYFLGLMINNILMELAKGLFGEPRPIFFEVCKPDALRTCNGTEYVSSFNCTSNYNWWLQMDSSRSFPSGHTSLSVYCGVFLAWYLQMRAFNWHGRTVTLVPLAQLCVLSFSVVSSLSRITDRRHHWWDVLAGSGLGLITVFHAIFCLCDNFSTSNSRKTEKPGDEETRGQTLLPVYH